MRRPLDRRFDLYRAQCRTLKLSDEAKEEILHRIKELTAEQDGAAGLENAVDSKGRAGENPSAHARRWRRKPHEAHRSATWPNRRRPLAAAAACAVAALALVAAAPLALTIAPHGDEDPSSPVAADNTGQQHDNLEAALGNHGFTIRAYAADANSEEDAYEWGTAVVSGNDQPIALFYPQSGGHTDTLWAEENGDITYAVFQDAFTVEGDNIERIQIHVSDGELYRQTIERNVPVYRRQSLLGPDPAQRGKWPGYEDCDALGYLERLVRDENGRQTRQDDVTRFKRIGAVIDLSKSDDERVGTRDIQFGQVIMATTPADDVPFVPPAGTALEDMFRKVLKHPESSDPTRFTITVTFNDGTCKTQVIELREGWTDTDKDGNPLHPVRIETERVEPDSMWVVYGAVVEENDEPFPYADLPANEYADTVMLPTPSCLDVSTPNE